MKYKLLPVYLLLLLVVLEGCSSGKKAYERGDYYTAVLKSVNRLRKNPDHKKSGETLRKSYPMALQTLEQKIQHIQTANDPYKWKKALNIYGQINQMYEEIIHAPGALAIIPTPRNYYKAVDEVRNKAAEESYQAGRSLLAQNTREAAKEAFFHFAEVERLVPGYKDVEDQIAEAEFMATLKVVVEQIPVPGRYSLSGNFFQEQIEAFLHSQYKGSHFVRFYTPAEARNEDLRIIDQYLQIQFDDFVVGQTHLSERIESVSRDSVKVGEVDLPDGGKAPVYGTVKAKIKTYRKEVASKGLLSMRIVDANNDAVLLNRKFPGEFIWFSEWSSFNGDERALSREQLARCELREALPPHPQDLFIELTKPIFGQLTSSVRDFYSRY
ncbi:hypothetical protein [Nafulsella turpanensis]|uniref:hypothetical protein n=1 Tax=Nafulsella turpanensis TaxID=1265690 RepID=UPI0003477AA4|nr:hypothetical protein [Nafulsella turpanensis]